MVFWKKDTQVRTLAGFSIWRTNYNTLSACAESFAWNKTLKLGQIPTLRTSLELQNLELHLISLLVFMCVLHMCEHGWICLDVIKKRWCIPRKWWLLLQLPLIPDHTALPFVLQPWASHHHSIASTLAYTITTVHSRASRLGVCSMPWPGRLICWHLPVVRIFYIKGRKNVHSQAICQWNSFRVNMGLWQLQH